MIMQAIASKNVIDLFLPQIERISDKFFQKWQSENEFKFVAAGHELMAEIFAQYLLGLDEQEAAKLAPIINEYMSDVLNGLKSVPIPLPGTWYFKGLTATAQLRGVLESILSDAIKDPKSEKERYSMHRMAKAVDKDTVETRAGLVTEILHASMAGVAVVGNTLANFVMSADQHRDVWL
jgi:cytochrome P450